MNYISETRAQTQHNATVYTGVGFTDCNGINAISIADSYFDWPGEAPWRRQATRTGENYFDMNQTADTDWHIFRLYRESPGTAGFQIDNTLTETTSTNVPTGNLLPFLLSYGYAGGPNEFRVDWTRVRKWANPDPTATVGPGQARFYRWTGNSSNQWNTPGNWMPGNVPTSGDNVVIPDVTNNPVKDNLTIGSSASLTIEAGGALTVDGNLTNNGTLNLVSDADGIASLITGSYTDGGTENIEIYLTGGGSVWHYISSPVTQLSTDVFTEGTDRSYRSGGILMKAILVIDNQDLGWVAWDGWNYSTG